MNDYILLWGCEKMKGDWINTKKVLWSNIIKPCWILKWCPYGQLIEEYPPEKVMDNKKMTCEVFGHHCPAFYQAELIREIDHAPEEIENKIQLWQDEIGE